MMTLDFQSLISRLSLVVTFPDSHRTVSTFCSWLDLDLLSIVLAFWISILKRTFKMFFEACDIYL